MMWGAGESCKYRVGETPEDGQLCVASLEEDEMMLCVRGNGEGSDNGWVLERHAPMQKVFDTVPSLPKDPLTRPGSAHTFWGSWCKMTERGPYSHAYKLSKHYISS
jgi:hypothetical protein